MAKYWLNQEDYQEMKKQEADQVAEWNEQDAKVEKMLNFLRRKLTEMGISSQGIEALSRLRLRLSN